MMIVESLIPPPDKGSDLWKAALEFTMRKYEKVTLPVVVALAALSNGAPSMCFSGFYGA